MSERPATTATPSVSPRHAAGAEDLRFRVRCWGARGSVPSPGRRTAAYGGNTACVEMRFGSRRLIFDAGTGIRLLGQELMREGEAVDADIFLTHFHWDHIQGFPFFAPIYDPETRLRIIAPEQQGPDLPTLFARQMGPIYFPIPFEAVAARIHFEHLDAEGWEEGPLRVRPMRMRHPSFTVGYRVEAPSGTVCYIPDNELVGGEYPVDPDWRERLAEFVEGADLLIHDAMFEEGEYEGRHGWGHSTYAQAVALAESARVGRILFFHHDPERSDGELRGVVERVREDLSRRGVALEVDAASEGSDITIEER